MKGLMIHPSSLPKRFAMRYVPYSLCLAGIFLGVGCTDSKWAFLGRTKSDDARFANYNPKAYELVEYLNRNAAKINAIECLDVDMDVKQGYHQPFGLSARMACEKPRNFRLVAKVFGKDEADIGSNNTEFWYWLARAEPPYLVHCSYQDLQQGVRIPFPFQPEWVMEALGMATYGPAQEYRLQAGRDRDTFELVRETMSQGQRVQKVIVFGRAPARVQVRAHELRDARGKPICTAQINEVAEVQGAVVPRIIVLSYPAEELRLKLRLFSGPRDITLNRQYDANMEASLFTRPSLAGVRTFDLAHDTYSPTNQVRPAGGIYR
jgi:hypothetical protein